MCTDIGEAATSAVLAHKDDNIMTISSRTVRQKNSNTTCYCQKPMYIASQYIVTFAVE